MTKMIGLFAGPGGICWGGELVGVKSVGIEWDANACATRRAAGLETVQGDVRDYGPKDFPECDTLTAGPPCQTFTTTGNGKGRRALSEVLHIAARMVQGKSVGWMLNDLTDERTGLVLEPLRWVLEAHRSGTPYRTVVMEQVPAVLPVWEAFATYLRDLGYSAATGLLRTERYGVPQTRKRAVLVASLDRTAGLPEPSHLPYVKNGVNDCVTMNQVLDRPEAFTVISNYGTGGGRFEAWPAGFRRTSVHGHGQGVPEPRRGTGRHRAAALHARRGGRVADLPAQLPVVRDGRPTADRERGPTPVRGSRSAGRTRAVNDPQLANCK